MVATAIKEQADITTRMDAAGVDPWEKAEGTWSFIHLLIILYVCSNGISKSYFGHDNAVRCVYGNQLCA